MLQQHGLHLSSVEYRQLAGCCEGGDELQGSIKCGGGGFLD